MDARERLRQYLEQRRELGESELVLDRMDVDDVLRVVGALRGGAGAPPAPAGPSAGAPPRPLAPPPASDGPRPPERTAEREAAPETPHGADWRAALG